MPFHIHAPAEGLFSGRIGRIGCRAIGRALGLGVIDQVYDAATGRHRAVDAEKAFVDRALDALDVRVDVAETELARVPRDGPLVVVANHPFGAVDGLALASLLRRLRGD